MSDNKKLFKEVRSDGAKIVFQLMQSSGSKDVAVMSSRDGYTIIRSIDPVSPTERLRHVSVSHVNDAVSVKVATLFAKAIYPQVRKWDAMQNKAGGIVHMWENAE